MWNVTNRSLISYRFLFRSFGHAFLHCRKLDFAELLEEIREVRNLKVVMFMHKRNRTIVHGRERGSAAKTDHRLCMLGEMELTQLGVCHGTGI